MNSNRAVQIAVISASLLFVVFFAAKSHAEDKTELIEKLKDWQSQTASRSDLENREKDQRILFINRLIFQIDRKYTNESLKKFISSALSDMMETDQLTLNQSFGSQALFIESLSESYESLLEKKEDPLAFVQAFTEFSTVTNPASSDDFAETRSYFDGKNVFAARGLSIEEAARILEEKEKARQSIPDLDYFNSDHDLRDDFIPELQKLRKNLNQSLMI